MTNTIVGMFDDYTSAENARSELQSIGVTNVDMEPSSSVSTASTTEPTHKRSFFDRLLGLGVPDEDAGLYAEGVRRGSYTLTVEADDTLVDDAASVLRRNGAIDIDRRAEHLRETGWSSYDASAPHYSDEERSSWRNNYSDWEKDRYGSDETVIPVVEEDIKIGKREVQGGGIRVYTRVTETPVEEDITLHKEQIRVDRRAANRAASESDMNAFQEGEFEMTERNEEAVVSKEARVVEEVVVGKEAKEETQRVRETKRRKDVEVERRTDKRT